LESNKHILFIREFIKNGKISEGFEELHKLLEREKEFNRFTDTSQLLSSRYARINNQINKGLISINDSNPIINQITHSFFDLLDEINSFLKTNEDDFPQLSRTANVKTKQIKERIKELTYKSTDKKKNNIDLGTDMMINKSALIKSLLSSGKKIKILFIAANPLDTSRLRLESEVREIENELSKSKFRNKFIFKIYLDARLDDLLQILLNDPPHFIHFSGHGNQDGILMVEDKTENSHLIKTENLANLFKIFSNKISCVFLNSCYSKFQGKQIASLKTYVIGMNDRVEDKVAIVFSKSFYKSIGAGKEIEFAFKLAKLSIALYNLEGEDIPELVS